MEDKRTMELLEEAYLSNEDQFDREAVMGQIGQYVTQLSNDINTISTKVKPLNLRGGRRNVRQQLNYPIDHLSDEQLNLMNNTLINAGVAIRNVIRSLDLE